MLLLWITVDVAVLGPLTQLDRPISQGLRALGMRHRPWPYDGAYVLTFFGKRGPLLGLVGAYLAFVLLWRRTVVPIARVALALIVLVVVVYLFKWGIGRTAPPVDLLHRGGLSYPSGHLPNAILMWSLLASTAVELDLPRVVTHATAVLRWLGPALVTAGIFLLDFHWMTDMVAGLAVGVILLWMVSAMVGSSPGEAMERFLRMQVDRRLAPLLARALPGWTPAG